MTNPRLLSFFICNPPKKTISPQARFKEGADDHGHLLDFLHLRIVIRRPEWIGVRIGRPWSDR